MLRRIATTSLLVCVSALATVVAAEGLLRLARYHPALQSGWMLTSPYVVPDDDVIMIPRKLRDPAFYVAHANPVVIAIGDSFTQGYPVDADAAFPAVLERELRRAGVSVDVVNAGMGDSGPDQQLRLLQTRLVPRLRPRIVVWALYANDLWDEILRAVFAIDGDELRPLPARENWIAIRQRFFERVPLPARVKRDSWAFNVLLKAFELRAAAAVPASEKRTPIAWAERKLALELDAFERLAAANAFEGWIVLIAPQSTYLAAHDPAWDGYWSAKDHRRLAALITGRRHAVVAAFGPEHASDVFADEERDASAEGDRHFNEAGYDLLGRLVAEQLLRDGATSQRALRLTR